MEKIIKEIKLARGILFHNENVLLVQDIRPGQGHYFLPGGNVEPGESIKETLPREWQEELGWDIKAGLFLGCLENKWNFKRKQDGAVVEVFEVNFLFMAEASKETLQQEPASKEVHLKFTWVPIKNLSSLYLLPSPLKSIIPDIANSKPNSIWASTL
jgi:8-oxo-dGTP pyrophosphatase MutT (NUDIX family)